MRSAALLLLLLLATGCATTRPWQRELLAKPVMEVEATDPLDTLHGHLLSVREGAVGAMGGGGGGCGCN
jgi:hypothetical protein